MRPATVVALVVAAELVVIATALALTTVDATRGRLVRLGVDEVAVTELVHCGTVVDAADGTDQPPCDGALASRRAWAASAALTGIVVAIATTWLTREATANGSRQPLGFLGRTVAGALAFFLLVWVVARGLRSGPFGAFAFDGYRGFRDTETPLLVPVAIAGFAGISGLVRRRHPATAASLVLGAGAAALYLRWLATALPSS